jgi:two-component system cell cycle sensor histidine kinase/response regulator CckA
MPALSLSLKFGTCTDRMDHQDDRFMTRIDDDPDGLARENAQLRDRIKELEAVVRALEAQHSESINAGKPLAWADAAPVGVFLLRGDSLLYLNAAMAGLSGLEVRDLIGKSWWKLMHPDDLKLVQQRLTGYHSGLGTPPVFRCRFLRPSGEVRWVQSYETFVDFGGEPAVLGFAWDITDWVESERQLTAGEEKYRMVVESAGEAIFTLDRQGAFLFMNGEAARQLGGSPENFIGRSQRDVFPQAMADRQMQAILGVFETGDGFSREVPTVMPDGRHFHHTTGVPIRDLDGRIVAVLCIARDVTDLVQARNALSESEAKYGRLMENLPVGVIQFSPEGRLVGGNSALARMYGYDTIEECLGAMAGARIPNQTKREEIERGLAEKGLVRDLEVEVQRRDGSTFWISLSARVRYDQEGKRVSVDGVEIDISQRKLAEEALRVSEAKYRDLFENAQVGMFRTTLDGDRILGANKRLAETFGYTVEEVMQMSALDMWYDDSERVAFVQAMIAKGKVTDFEFAVRTKSGERRTALVAARLLGQEIEGSVTDITERKQAELALAESEQLFRALAESAPAVIVIYQGERIVYANQQLLHNLDLTPSDLKELKFWELIAPEYREKIRTAGMARQRGEEVPGSYEVKVLTRGGQEKWALFSGQRITYKGEPAGLAIAVDITERKKMEDRLRESEERFRHIAERSFDAIFLVDIDGMIRYTSPSVEHVSGYPPEQVTNRHLSEFIVANYMSAVGKGLALLSTGQSVEGLQFEIIAVDGQPRFVEANAVPIIRDERVVAFQVMLRDTTGRKRAEQMLQDAYEEQSRQLRQVAGGLAHDIYNDLFPVTTSLYKLRQRLEKSNDSEKDRSLRLLALSEGAISRAVRLTESVNLYSKMQKSKIGACADLTDVLGAVLEHNRERITGMGVLVTTSAPEHLMVGCDRHQLHPLLNNLLLNSLDALEGSSVRTIEVRAGKKKDRVKLDFRDSGSGIAPDILPRIFEPFFSTKPNTGTGLGLAIVKRIVDITGGTITVQSALDTGTIFSILLPGDVGTS